MVGWCLEVCATSGRWTHLLSFRAHLTYFPESCSVSTLHTVGDVYYTVHNVYTHACCSGSSGMRVPSRRSSRVCSYLRLQLTCSCGGLSQCFLVPLAHTYPSPPEGRHSINRPGRVREEINPMNDSCSFIASPSCQRHNSTAILYWY